MFPPQELVLLIEKIVLPSLEALAKLEEEKEILDGGVVAGARTGAFVVELASDSELNRLLQELPFWGVVKWKATPFISIRAARSSSERISSRTQDRA
jgi:hypothetical protein